MAGMTPDAGGGFGGAGQSNAAFKQQLNKIYAWYQAALFCSWWSSRSSSKWVWVVK